jgi:hypothetical protein
MYSYDQYVGLFRESVDSIENDQVEDVNRRQETFHRNYERIRRHNKRGNMNYKLDLNHMADWLPHELDMRFPLIPPRNHNKSSRSLPPHLEEKHWPSSSTPDLIDWSADMNPFKSSIMPEVKNQGMCGSCWAFATIASTEASIHIATGQAPPALSVQELIDCDTQYNRGCYGGNPVLAYDYIMNMGVTGWNDYPYLEGKQKCRRPFLEARAKIDGFLMISSFDQKNLKRFVATGPVSIGICGTDFSFMFYAGGVYDQLDCCTVQNHAMIIVGYGYDEDTELDYWLLQNSWGTRWGEHGYMRILRTEEIGIGLCGLASTSNTHIYYDFLRL